MLLLHSEDTVEPRLGSGALWQIKTTVEKSADLIFYFYLLLSISAFSIEDSR